MPYQDVFQTTEYPSHIRGETSNDGFYFIPEPLEKIFHIGHERGHDIFYSVPSTIQEILHKIEGCLPPALEQRKELKQIAPNVNVGFYEPLVDKGGCCINCPANPVDTSAESGFYI